LALLFQRSVQGLFRMHQRQIVDFTPGRPHRQAVRGRQKKKKGMPTSRWIKSLGKDDQLVEWRKPIDCPTWLASAQFAALPETLVVRELRYRIERPGFRVEEVTLVTTLVDAERYSQAALAQLYLKRWRIETNFAHLKTTMGMDALHCQSVEGVLKEATMFALVYKRGAAVDVRGRPAPRRVGRADQLHRRAPRASTRRSGRAFSHADRQSRTTQPPRTQAAQTSPQTIWLPQRAALQLPRNIHGRNQLGLKLMPFELRPLFAVSPD
jgi:hypothetical protein